MGETIKVNDIPLEGRCGRDWQLCQYRRSSVNWGDKRHVVLANGCLGTRSFPFTVEGLLHKASPERRRPHSKVTKMFHLQQIAPDPYAHLPSNFPPKVLTHLQP